VLAPFKGVLRGLLHPGLTVQRGLKIGDLDPRDDPRYCTLVSDKSLAVGGGVLEIIFSQTRLRPNLWK
jgi:xanthine dehydrogenase accessory factor